MTKSPKVIFNSRYTLGFNNPDNKYCNKQRSIKRIQNMYHYYKDENKKVMSMFDYYVGKINKEETVNLILENGKFATEKEIEKRKQLAAEYLKNSNLYQGVLSFNNDYINQNIDIHKLEQELAKNILPMYFKKCGFKDPDKMFYQLSLHGNTKHLHFHFSYMEKEPNYIYSKNKVGYKRKGKISKEEMDFLKNQIIHTIEKEKIYTPLLKKTNEEIDELKKYFNPKEKNYLLKDKKDLIYENKILRLGQLLYMERLGKDSKIKYGSIKNKEIQQLTKEIKNYIFSKSNDVTFEYKKFKSSLEQINSYFNNINKNNHIKNPNINKDLTISKEKYMNNYIYNAIVNYAQINYKKEISSKKNIKENDIIQSIVFQNYLKNKKQTRKNILDNYFSNPNSKQKYKNKYNIEKSVRKMNDEMEEALKEFSKLFSLNEYDKKETIERGNNL